MARYLLMILLSLLSTTAAAGLQLDHAVGSAPNHEDDLPPGFYVESAAPGATFDSPVALAFAPDGRIFVAEKSGKVFVIQYGMKVATPFIDLEDEVLDHWDRGLLGIEVDPNFVENGYVYLLYAVDQDGSGDHARFDVFGRLVRYTADPEQPNRADLDSRLVLIGATFNTGIPACYYSHAPGALRFGADGTLLVSAGDAANFNRVDSGGLYPECFGPDRIDPYEDIGAFRSQYLGSMAGKILRLDPATGLGLPSNPHFTGDPAAVESKVWLAGLRNPFRFGVRPGGSADPTAGQPGALFVGDVGWNNWEEEDIGKVGGENFGWPCREGPVAHNGYQNANPAHTDCSTVSETTPPQFYWSHTDETISVPPGLKANAIVGGEFYQGIKYPAGYQGRVFYGDFTRHWLATATVDANNDLVAQEVFAPDLASLVDIRYDPVSEYIYYVDIFAGAVMRIRHADENASPVAVATAEPSEGYAPLTVQFTGSASYDPLEEPLTFAWEFGDGEGAEEADPSHTYTADGVYTAVLTVTDTAELSTAIPLTISVGNTSPTATIVQPEDGAGVAVEQTIDLVAAAFDADQPETTLTFRWEVIQRHNNHGHPDVYVLEGQTAQFTVLEHGLLDEVNFLEIELMVTDAGGLADTVAHRLWLEREVEEDITLQGTPIALVTEPAGSGNPDLEVIRDGIQPPAGSDDPLQQYDTYDGQLKPEDWIGYEYDAPRFFARILFQEGIHGVNGGWFDSFRVEVRQAGEWHEVEYLNALPFYPGADGINYGSYVLLFLATLGDAIRIVGEPGGFDDYISVGELRVFEIPRADFAATPRRGESPLTVDFTDLSTLADPTGFLWDFGDGQQSDQRHPRHIYAAPGTYTVSLTVSGSAGDLLEQREGYIEVDVLARDFADFADVSALVLNGDAAQAGAALRLAPDDTNRVGTAFLDQEVVVDGETTFATDFRFRLHGDQAEGADGLVFMVQGQGASALGASGGGLGYQGIATSLAVEIDIYQNPGDPDGNHVGVDVNGNVTASLVTATPEFDLADGTVHRLWVDYNGAIDLLAVYLSADTMVKPATPVLQVSELDLAALVGETAHFGFGAGTGGAHRHHDVESWSLHVVSAGLGAPPAGDPVLASFSPASGLAGTRVLITGANLAAATAVDFGGTATTNFTVLSSSQLVADVPFGAETGPITVATAEGDAASASAFTVTEPHRLEVVFTDFVAATNLQLNGSASLVPPALRLTGDFPDRVGTAFYGAAVPLTDQTSFAVAARLHLHGLMSDGAEGLAFVVQGDSLTALGDGGGGLGYGGLATSLAVEIDIEDGPGDPGYPDDPLGPHLAVHLGGDPALPAAFAALPFDPEGGQDFGLWIDYHASTDSLLVFVGVDPAAKPDTALVAVGDLALLALVGPAGHFGFTGATGNVATRIQDLESWRLEVSVPAHPVAAGDPADGPPRRFALGRVYPNPFNPHTNVEYAVPHPAQVKLAIYAVNGRRVRTLVDGLQSAGVKQVVWDGTDQGGRAVGSGVYFVRFESAGVVESRKVVLLK